ncbi:asparagine synthase-related protein [Streptomyces sp. NPDC007088]|uniref:asparagine synthase-related protein n=1 Tax=Streptomyces sp. NPDC007088 TaxID=3364773 RepID=UPI00368C4DF2
MHEEWITGGTSSLHWSAGGRAAEGLPGVRVGQGCRARVVADDRARIAVVGDVVLLPGEEEGLLRSAAEGQWASLTRLTGSYWVVAQTRAHSFVCGDLSGLRGVFYSGSHGPHILWSTSARRLAQHLGAAPDLAMVAARLAAGPEHWPDSTAYEHVLAVPPGNGLLLGADRPELVDVVGTEPVSTLAQGAPAFGDALRRAVAWRMREAGGLASADVSGGLDSSAVAVLAAREGEVRAVTYADEFTSTEDLHFARKVAEHIGTRLHVGNGGPGELPFGWSPSQPVTEQPAALSLTTAQHALYLKPAAGLPLHFTGNGGDIVLDSCSAAWIGMVQRGDRRAAHRQVTDWARARNLAPRELWRAVTQAAGNSHPGALENAAARLIRGEIEGRRPGVWTWCHMGQFAAWLTPQGREEVAILLREAASRSDAYAEADLTEQRSSLRLVGADARETAPLAASWRIRQVHPYLDNQVVRAAFAIAPAERHGVATFKPLLATALPFLPPWLTSRTSKGSFSRQLTAGLLHHRPALATLISTSPLVAGGLLDPDPALRALAGIGGARSDALYDIQRLIMSCQWLARIRPVESESESESESAC